MAVSVMQTAGVKIGKDFKKRLSKSGGALLLYIPGS